MGYDCYALGTIDGDRDETAHFGVNVAGWVIITDAMADADLLDMETPAPKWPRSAWCAPDNPRWQETASLRNQRSPNPLQVPFYKVTGNDGYIITPEECYLLFHRLKRAEHSLARAFGEYCGRMVARGGFEVW